MQREDPVLLSLQLAYTELLGEKERLEVQLASSEDKCAQVCAERDDARMLLNTVLPDFIYTDLEEIATRLGH